MNVAFYLFSAVHATSCLEWKMNYFSLFLGGGGGAGGVASVTFYGCSLNNLYFDFFLGGLLLFNELS